MKKKKILICDDIASTRERWKTMLEKIPSVRQEFEIETVGDRFKQTMGDLEGRRRKARNRKVKVSSWGSNLFDSAAVLMVDYDLFDFNREDYITGEGVAYLARCYSRCGLIVAVNQFGENAFDLTLKCNPQSFADLNVGSKQLANPGLWKEPWKGFRPSYWPNLPAAVTSFEHRVNDLKNNLNRTVLSYLGFSRQISENLPRSSREFLGSGDKPESVKFGEFVSESGNGLRRKDQALDSESTARIAASRIAKWLERMVLAGQDVLVDAPHLVSRFPSLLVGKSNTLGAWNKTVSVKGLKGLGVRYRKVEKFRFERQDWLSRPAWFWKPLTNSEDIAEVEDPWKTQLQDYVFCEDISKFLPRAAAREFVADLPSPFVRRFVVDPKSKQGRRFASSVKGVEYVPAVRFSL
ncbi:MAG TPA: hypothetical protein VEM96_02265 [Pyrinomonadaceae bacterium]|nr:hypothetical protein [Pyrinomonadaceae bacterium]